MSRKIGGWTSEYPQILLARATGHGDGGEEGECIFIEGTQEREDLLQRIDRQGVLLEDYDTLNTCHIESRASPYALLYPFSLN